MQTPKYHVANRTYANSRISDIVNGIVALNVIVTMT